MPDKPPNVVAYISAGASIEPRSNLLTAADMLREHVNVTAVSTVCRTPAIDRSDDPDFWNCVFQIETSIEPRELKGEVLSTIERAIGRKSSADRYAPRAIDLDLVLYGQTVTDEAGLKLPHPDLARSFVRAAVLELDPARQLPEASDMGECGEPLLEFTECLRRRSEQ